MSVAFITGANGFIGKAFAEETKGIFQQILLDSEVFDGDWKANLIRKLSVSRPDVVFHFGACSDTQNRNLDEMMLKNVLFTYFLVDWCILHKIPLIYSSSAAVYGFNSKKEQGDIVIQHDLTLYAYSKLIGEKSVIQMGGIGLRYFNVYGHDERHKGNMSSVALQSYFKHLKGERVEIFQNKPQRDFVYVKDVISANLHAWYNYRGLQGGFYDVGTGKARTFEDVLDIMRIPYSYAPLERIPPKYQFYTKAESRNKMKGWYPQWSLEAGLEEYKAILDGIYQKPDENTPENTL
jgi:ADP-L-glycero-D-manno-heptose 6-epimerase